MHGNSGAGFDRHLAEDQFEELLRGDLTPSERQVLQAHLSTCPECQQAYDDYIAIADVLANLPQLSVPRSFQLSPEQARTGASFWGRLATFLFPMLPAMRAATLALVLMFGAVTAARILDDAPGSPDSVEFASDLVPTSTVAQQPAPANADPESGGAIAIETVDSAARKDPEDGENVPIAESDEAPTEIADEVSQSEPADEGADSADSGPADEVPTTEEFSHTGPADDVSDPAGTGPIDESDSVEESSDAGPAADSGPADEAETESIAMEAPAGDVPAETTEAFESAPVDEDSSSAAGSTEMQLPGVASPEATATASTSPSATSTATTTPSPSPTATSTVAPTATATASPAPTQDDDGLDFGEWPLGGLQVLLGALVLLLGSIVVAVSRMGRR